MGGAISISVYDVVCFIHVGVNSITYRQGIMYKNDLFDGQVSVDSDFIQIYEKIIDHEWN